MLGDTHEYEVFVLVPGTYLAVVVVRGDEYSIEYHTDRTGPDRTILILIFFPFTTHLYSAKLLVSCNSLPSEDVDPSRKIPAIK